MQSPYVCTYTILLLPFEYIESIITINIYIYVVCMYTTCCCGDDRFAKAFISAMINPFH